MQGREPSTFWGLCASYSLGWSISDKFGMRLIGHNGGQQGTSTSIILAPERRCGVVVLANMDDVDVDALAQDLLKIIMDLKNQTP